MTPQPKPITTESRPRKVVEDVESIPFVRDLLNVFNAKVLNVQTLKAVEVAAVPSSYEEGQTDADGLDESNSDESEESSD